MNKLFRLSFCLILLFSLTSCSNIFELNSDVLARQALFDLMKIEEKFYQENKRFAGTLVEIEKYNFKYDTGIVYMEIERQIRTVIGPYPCLLNRLPLVFLHLTQKKVVSMKCMMMKFLDMS